MSYLASQYKKPNPLPDDPPIIKEDAPTPILILAEENKTLTKATRHTGVISTDSLTGKSPSLSPLVASPNEHPAADDDSSDSGGSYLSYASPSRQRSPVSSRAGTPPPEEPQLLSRAVDIMKQIAADDQRILVQAAALRQRAAGLKEQAREVRDVLRVEQGRRVRLEAYFTYWREITPEWPKDWIYEEGEEDLIRTERVLRTMTPPYVPHCPSLTRVSYDFVDRLPSTGPTGPPTLSFDGRDAP